MALQDLRYGTNIDLQGYQAKGLRLEQRASDPSALNAGSIWHDTATNQAKAYDGAAVRPLYADDDDFHSLAIHSVPDDQDELLIADYNNSYAYKRISKQALFTGISTLTNAYYRLICETGTANLDASGASAASISGDGSVLQSVGSVVGMNTVSIQLKNQSANRVLAGPTSGGTAYPTFRALLNSDMPVGYNHSNWDAAYTHSTFVGNPHGVTASSIGAEPALGNPAVSGYVLSSTVGGTRSWIAMAGGGSYTFASGLTEATGTVNLGGALSAAVQFTGGGTYDFEIGTSGSKINSFNMYADNDSVIHTDTNLTINATDILLLEHNSGGKSLSLNASTMLVTDTDDLIGLQYNANYSAAGISLGARWIPDWAAVIGQVAGNNISSLITTPTATQDGYAITWDHSLGKYDLTAAGGTSFWTDNGSSLSPSKDLLEHTVSTKINVVDFDYGNGILIGNYDAAFAARNGYFFADQNQADLACADGAGTQVIRVSSPSGITITDGLNSRGAYYAADYSVAGKVLGARWIPDWNAVTTQLGGNDVTALITAPGAGQDGLFVSWDESGNQYTLSSAPASLWTDNGSSLSPASSGHDILLAGGGAERVLFGNVNTSIRSNTTNVIAFQCNSVDTLYLGQSWIQAGVNMIPSSGSLTLGHPDYFWNELFVNTINVVNTAYEIGASGSDMTFKDGNNTTPVTLSALLAGGGGSPMVYPDAGIAVSTGLAWDTSITDNSTNWNTAYSHSQVSSGNPHSVAWSELSGVRSGISLSGFDDDLTYNDYSHPNHFGQVTSAGDGATVLTVSAITAQNELTSGLASTSELLVSHSGIKRMDVSVLESYMQSNLSFGSGTVTVSGSPSTYQVALWDSPTSIKGHSGLLYNPTYNSLQAHGNLFSGDRTTVYHSSFIHALIVASTGSSEASGIEIVGNYTTNTTVGSLTYHNTQATQTNKAIAKIAVNRYNNNNAGAFYIQSTNDSGTMRTNMLLAHDLISSYIAGEEKLNLNSAYFMPKTANGLNLGSDSQHWYVLYTQNARIKGLAGTGDRMVVADSLGDLSTQAIPSGGGSTPPLGTIVSGTLHTSGDATHHSTGGTEELIETISLTNAEYEGSQDGTRIFEIRIGGIYGAVSGTSHGTVIVKLGTQTLISIDGLSSSLPCSYSFVFRIAAISSTASLGSGHMISNNTGGTGAYRTLSGSSVSHGTGSDLKIYTNHSGSAGDSPWIEMNNIVVEVFEV